ncbi:aldo/keto reductase [Porticoccus sp. GXU_MW_L64]
MNKIPMCPEGPLFSRLVQGYWRLSEWGLSARECLDYIKQHLELGISTVDHAHIYGYTQTNCEQLFGDALRLEPSLRDRLEIVSKCGIYPENPGKAAHYDTGSKAMEASVNLSLNRLGIEQLDVLLIHRPDYLLDADEVAATFERLKAAGKVKHFGVSNFTPGQFALLQSRLDAPLVTNQVEINPLRFAVTEDGTLDQLQQLRVRPMAWSCLAGGAIFTGDSDQEKRLRKVLTELQEELAAKSLDQVIIAWVLRLPCGAVPVLGSRSIERTAAAVEAVNLNMNREQWYRVWEASKGHRIP